MSRGFNQVILVGNLGADPETRTDKNGSEVTSFRLATSESWVDKITGERKERTEWHRVVMFSKLAELAGRFLAKGKLVQVLGRIHTRKWEDQEGQPRYTTEIIAKDMIMLDKRDYVSGSGDDGYAEDNRDHY